MSPFEQLARWAAWPSGESDNALLHRLLSGAHRYIAEAGAQEDFDEVVGKLDPGEEEWAPELFWQAARVVGARIRAARERSGVSLGLTLGQLEGEEIELSNSAEELLDAWAALLTHLAGTERPGRDRLFERSAELAAEYVDRRPELSAAVLRRLQEIREELAS